MDRTNRNMILAIISYCCLFLTILFVDHIKTPSLYFFVPVLSFLLIYLFLPYRTKLQITFSYQFIMLTTILLFSMINIFPVLNNVSVINKGYLLILIITICLINLYFSNSKKEIKTNVYGLMVLLITLMIKLYPILSSQYQNLIVAYFFVQFAFLLLLQIKTNTERIYLQLVNSEKFNDQKLLYSLINEPILSEKSKIRIIEKISDSNYIKRIVTDAKQTETLRAKAFEKMPILKIKNNLESIPSKLIISAIEQLDDKTQLLDIVEHFPQEYGIAATERLFLNNNIIYNEKTAKYLFVDVLAKFIRTENSLGVIGICRRIIDCLGLGKVSLLINNFNINILVEWYNKQEAFDFELQYALCTCFEKFPSVLLIKKITENWVNFENELRRKQDDVNQDENHHIEIVSGILLRAIAACSSMDENYINLERDASIITEIQNLETKRKEIYEKMEPLKDRQIEIKSKYTNAVDAIRDDDFIETNEKLKDLNEEFQVKEQEIFEKHILLSAANIIQRVIADGQRYSNYIRQNAEIGLNILLSESNLNEEVKNELMEFIKNSNENQDEDDDYLTHEVRLFENSKVGEILYVLLNSYSKVSGGSIISNDVLKNIIEKIFDKLSNAITFLEQYPLKLMRNDIKQRLGWYLHKGYKLTYWTRYTPPKDIGQVHKRFLTLNNLSVPNGMGLDYRLFQNELLILPVLYHEYLHYTGIKNESEVWFKQSIFLRLLIVDFAEDYPNIIEYHQKVLQVFQMINDRTSNNLLSLNPETDTFVNYLNQIIYQNYGKPVDNDEAKEIANNEIIREDGSINNMNRELIWHPEVEYPMLKENGETAIESDNIRKIIESIIISNKTQNNFMTSEKHKELLTNDEIKMSIRKWNDFQIKLKNAYAKMNYDYNIENPQYITNLSFNNFVNYW